MPLERLGEKTASGPHNKTEESDSPKSSEALLEMARSSFHGHLISMTGKEISIPDLSRITTEIKKMPKKKSLPERDTTPI